MTLGCHNQRADETFFCFVVHVRTESKAALQLEAAGYAAPFSIRMGPRGLEGT